MILLGGGGGVAVSAISKFLLHRHNDIMNTQHAKIAIIVVIIDV